MIPEAYGATPVGIFMLANKFLFAAETNARLVGGRSDGPTRLLSYHGTQAEAAEFKIDKLVPDHAQSGVTTTLAERPEGKRLFDKLRHDDLLVVRWVDRLGRNYQDALVVEVLLCCRDASIEDRLGHWSCRQRGVMPTRRSQPMWAPPAPSAGCS